MILQILLPRLIAKHDPESAVRIHINGFLHIHVAVRNRVVGGLRWIVFGHLEMHLAIHQPVVNYGICGAVLPIQPNQIAAISAIHVRRTLVHFRNEIISNPIRPVVVSIKGKGIALESRAPGPAQRRTAGRPPKRIDFQSPYKPHAHLRPEKRRAEEQAAPEKRNRPRPKAQTASRPKRPDSSKTRPGYTRTSPTRT